MIWRKRLVRVHFQGHDSPSLEGILVERTGGHFKLANARHIETSDVSFQLDGSAWIPRERVLYLQEIG